MKKRQTGVSLIEFVLALGIGVAVTAAVWSAYRSQDSVVEVRRTSAAVVDFIEVANEVYAHSVRFVNSDGTEADLEDLRASSRYTPPGVFFNEGTNTWENLWGGDWTISVESSQCSPGCAQDLLVQTLTELPEGTCVLLTNVVAPRMYDTYINGSLVALLPEPSAAGAGRQGTDVSQVANLCIDGDNTVQFRDLKRLDLTQLASLPAGSLVTYETEYQRVQDALAAREAAQLAL